MARLRHPNIVQIHGVGQHAGAPYLVLEMVEGRSLAQVLGGTPQPADWSAQTTEAARGRSTRRTSSASCTATCRRANVLLAADGHAQDHRLRPGQVDSGAASRTDADR